MLRGGARWAVERGYGRAGGPRAHRGARRDGRRRSGAGVRRGQAAAARRDGHARLGQPLSRGAARRRGVRSRRRAEAFGLRCGDVVVSIHCGSRGLGHQIGTEFLREMAISGARRRASRCPIASSRARRSARRSGERYLGAMRAAINCALANRQILTHLTRAGLPRGAARGRSSRCSTTCRTTRARSRRTSSTAGRASSTCIARARRARSARAIPTCRSRCARPASRC